MSRIALEGNVSGTGVFTLASPNSNTNRTLDIPDASGTIDRLNRAGNVLQVVTGDYGSTLSTNSNSFSDLISLAITPSSASNKILIFVNMYFAGMGAPKVLRDATAIVNPLQNYAFYHYYSDGTIPYSSGTRTMQAFQVYDSPATTSSITYKLQIQGHSASQYVVINPDTSNNFSTTSPAQSLTRMTLMEIAA